MRAIPFKARRHWQRHVMDNAYQAEVLADKSQQYWVEALANPFYVQFSSDEEQKIADATEALGAMCQEFLDWFFSEENPGEVDARLRALGIKPAYWEAIKASWDRTEPEDLSLYVRFDLAVPEFDGPPKLLEINGETPLLGCETVYQWNWLADMLSHQARDLPPGASQANDFWDLVCAQLDAIMRTYGSEGKIFSFLVDEKLNEDIEMAAQLIQMIEDSIGQYCQIVFLRDQHDEQGNVQQRGIGMDDEGYLVDHTNHRMPFIWKVYDWSDLQNDVEAMGKTDLFARRLETGEVKILEPLWKQVLSNKGSLAFIWAQFKDHPVYGQYLLETHFEAGVGAEVTKLLCKQHVRKPFLGLEGVATTISDGSLMLEARESFGYGEEGFVIQEYTPLPTAFDYYYMVGSWLVGGLEDGKPAGFIIRGDKSQITGRHCLIIPHVVSDRLVAGY
jgi:glutathionylspermidine synthase